MLISEHFMDNYELKEFEASPIDIKRKWFDRDSKIQANYIRSILRDEFKLRPQNMKKYAPFKLFEPHSDFNGDKKTGTPFLFLKKDFDIDDNIINKSVIDDSIAPF
jgi:hypothetical protein